VFYTHRLAENETIGERGQQLFLLPGGESQDEGGLKHKSSYVLYYRINLNRIKAPPNQAAPAKRKMSSRSTLEYQRTPVCLLGRGKPGKIACSAIIFFSAKSARQASLVDKAEIQL